MARRSPSTTQQVDADGVRTIAGSGVRRSVWLLLAAMTLVGVAILLVIRPAIQQTFTAPAAVRPSDASADARAPGATAAPRQAPRQSAPAVAQAHPPDGGAPSERLAPATPPARAPAPDSAPAATGERGGQQTRDEPTGLALFPPPGTKPIKRGIVVPDDAELPPGYVRHYQTTDDGQQLPPILMFHPDYQPLDEHGQPVPVPDDRIVPPEMAPSGIPARMLEVPEEGAEVEAPTGGRKRPAP
jgi:hypothetical protein